MKNSDFPTSNSNTDPNSNPAVNDDSIFESVPNDFKAPSPSKSRPWQSAILAKEKEQEKNEEVITRKVLQIYSQEKKEV